MSNVCDADHEKDQCTDQRDEPAHTRRRLRAPGAWIRPTGHLINKRDREYEVKLG